MPDPGPGQHDADCNLVYGMLALQMNFVSRDGLVAAMQAWVFEQRKPLGQVLQEQGQLTVQQREALDQLLASRREEHAGAWLDSLAAATVPATFRKDLPRFAGAPASEATLPYIPSSQSEGDRFLVLRPHAQGGLGEVFIALDQEVHREVALKEIQARYASDPESRARFVREAEITGGLEHPGIVPVYGLGVHADGRPYYAMRFIQGETLKEAIARLHTGAPGVTLRSLLTRFVAVCNAVAYAHSRGVLHRDLKPANVMLGKYGETLVVDWGLAKAGHESARGAAHGFEEVTLLPHSGDSSVETRLGSTIGTPAYMSPEQAAG
jgi:tRNA A-37 threonylcarbamoyl transferase component Bud32